MISGSANATLISCWFTRVISAIDVVLAWNEESVLPVSMGVEISRKSSRDRGPTVDSSATAVESRCYRNSNSSLGAWVSSMVSPMCASAAGVCGSAKSAPISECVADGSSRDVLNNLSSKVSMEVCSEFARPANGLDGVMFSFGNEVSRQFPWSRTPCNKDSFKLFISVSISTRRAAKALRSSIPCLMSSFSYSHSSL